MSDLSLNVGEKIYLLMKRLWPICRSITGPGVRETLSIVSEHLPELTVHEVPTGTRCFDWVVPKEWSVKDAYIVAPDGTKLAEFNRNNLHLVGYSIPIDKEVNLDELQDHLHSLPEQPDAIPYVTSYYRETWGFCVTHRARQSLAPGRYKVYIDSALRTGSLTYGEMLLAGRSKSEVLLSTYICHPSMANNELSGPCLTAHLAKWLRTLDRRLSYRILFIPETIGAICYLSSHLDELQEKVIAGYVINCVGDDRSWSFMPSRHGNTLSDQAARHVLKYFAPNYREFTFLERGSDERQYCSPGVDLPVSSIMRSKYGTYPEYHTSLDNMDVVSPAGLEKSLSAYKRVIETLEGNVRPRSKVICEPMMSKRGLRPTLGKRGSAEGGRVMMNLLAYSDGTRNLLEIGNIIEVPVWELAKIAQLLLDEDLIELNDA